MGAMMTENCAGCGFEFSSGELFEHEQACEVLLRDRLEDAKSALSARDAEIERLRSLVEKRERQLVWALRACGDDEALKFYGLDILAMSDDEAGLLAAIDEATETKEKK